MSGYLGSKEGCWKRIAHEIPECDVLISPFAGQCALTRLMNPPRLRVVADRDPDVIDWWHANEPGVVALQRNAVEWLEGLALNVLSQVVQTCPTRDNYEEHARAFAKWMGLAKAELRGLNDDGRVLLKIDGQWIQPLPLTTLPRERIRELLDLASPQMAAWPASRQSAAASPDWAALPTVIDWPQWWDKVVLYLDPPYVLSTRSDEGSVYSCDMTDADHVRLLRAIRWLPCCVVISGYDSPLYAKLLKGWRRIEFIATTRGGPRTEVLWTNGPEPQLPNDLTQLGTNRREREKLAKRDRRQMAKYLRLPLGERLRLYHAVRSTLPPEMAAAADAAVCGGSRLDAGSSDANFGGADVGTVSLRSRTELPRGGAAEDGDHGSGSVWGPSSNITVEADSITQAGGSIGELVENITAAGSGGPVPGTVSVRGTPRVNAAEIGGEVLATVSVPGQSVSPPACVRGPSECESSTGTVSPLRDGLVLSLFPGIGLLDLAFEQVGFTVTRGPDLIWGGDVRKFDATALRGSIWGVIGGPPCQDFSQARKVAPTGNGDAMLDEFKRIVGECQPTWWMAENVVCVPDIQIEGYSWQRCPIDLTWFAAVRRRRHIQFGSVDGHVLDLRPPSPLPKWDRVAECVVASRRDGISWKKKAELMGLPKGWDVPAMRREELGRAIGNGVPIPMGRFLAEACAAAFGVFGRPTVNLRTERRCACPCQRPVGGKATYFETNCRKVAETRRKRGSPNDHSYG